jgi:predicted Rossmann fold flavoprotein
VNERKSFLTFDLLVIGGGAAGFFGALTAAEFSPKARIILLEKSGHLLSKVKISGGGRCNVTHQFSDVTSFSRNYPRGEKLIVRLLHQFSPLNTMQWFARRGVNLKTESDGRMFPETDSSQTIVDCLQHEIAKFRIPVGTGESVESIEPLETGFRVITSKQELLVKSILIATGGHPKLTGFEWLAKLGISISAPVPSLFTFNLPDHPLQSLMGLSVQDVRVRVESTKLDTRGPLLITHWGFSGPAVLRCSAWGAKELAALNYNFRIRLHWIPELTQDEIREFLSKQRISNPRKKVASRIFDSIPQRLWEALCSRSGISDSITWADLSGKLLNQLVESICADAYQVKGKTTFKEEFVTSGGIMLSEIDPQTCMIRKIPGLFVAGEVMDVDGITGGFNFQHAWSSGFVAGKSIAKFIQ